MGDQAECVTERLWRVVVDSMKRSSFPSQFELPCDFECDASTAGVTEQLIRPRQLQLARGPQNTQTSPKTPRTANSGSCRPTACIGTRRRGSTARPTESDRGPPGVCGVIASGQIGRAHV